MALLQQSVFIYVLVTRIVQAFQLPTSVYYDVAMYSSINATSTCSSPDVLIDGTSFTCNPTCPTRTDFPKRKFPLESLPANCKPITDHSLNFAESGNGNIVFDETTTSCNVVIDVATPTTYFTLTLWIKVTCIGDW